MDVALEFVDTYYFDSVYARLLPAHLPYKLDSSNTTNHRAASPWRFKPSNPFITFEPREEAYMSAWPRDNIYRQTITLYIITWLVALAIYFIISTLSYIFIFDKTTLKHPKYLKNQIRQEITQAVRAMPWITVLTTPFFLAEVRGFSKLYDTTAQGPGRWYDYAQMPLFLLFTDFCIYFIHRGLHHPRVYKYLHKAHHKWIMPTPYAAVAFHPLDGFAQSLPYHLYPFFFPLQKFAYLALFIFVQVWTVFIHDGEYVANSAIINGAACHSLHHTRFEFNYGQYTTLWDRIGGTYLRPTDEMFERSFLQKKLS